MYGLTMFLFLIILGTVCLASTDRPDHDPTIPIFNDHPQNFLVQVGDDVHMTCSVTHIGELTIAWTRQRDLHILSVGSAIYAVEPRMSIGEPVSKESVTLVIRNVSKFDDGLYLCQMSTEPIKSRIYNITVYESEEDQRRSGMEALQSNFSALSHTVFEFRKMLDRQLEMVQKHPSSESSDRMHHHHHKSDKRHHHSSVHRSKPRRHHNHCSRGHGHETHASDGWIKFPKVRNPEEYDIAICHMRSNSDTNDTNIHGAVYLLQKKNSATLYMYVLMAGFNSTNENSIKDEESLHGFHVHENPDLSSGCDSAGPAFKPHGEQHGDKSSEESHPGDFGNLASDSNGIINELITDEKASLRGDFSIIGKPLVVHAVGDDEKSHNKDHTSTSSSHSTERVACCVIEAVETYHSGHKHGGHDHYHD